MEYLVPGLARLQRDKRHRGGRAPRSRKAQTLLMQTRIEKRWRLLDTYLKTNASKDAQALVERGDAYEALNRYTEAAADYTAALAINPDFAYAYAFALRVA